MERTIRFNRFCGIIMLSVMLLLCACTSTGNDVQSKNNSLTDSSNQEVVTLTNSSMSLTIAIPTSWENIAEFSVGDEKQTSLYTTNKGLLFHLCEKTAINAYPDGDMGNVWWLRAMTWGNFKEWSGYDSLPISEILGIADYVIGADDEYVYMIELPTDIQWLENNQISKEHYDRLCADSQEVLDDFLKRNEIVPNEECPISSVFSPEKLSYDTYAVGEVTISVPKEFHNIVVIDTTENDDWLHQVIALYYKPAYEAHDKFGKILSIMRCSYEQMIEILENGADGIVFQAVDGDQYYFIEDPLDVQWNNNEEFREYYKIRKMIKISFGKMQCIQKTDDLIS